MRTQLKEENAREEFFISLAKFQSEIPTIKKTKIVKDKDGTVRYKYAPLESIVEQVKELLETNGFSYTLKSKQTPITSVTVVCEAHHSFGHVENTEITVPIDQKAYMNDVQKIGAAVTYAKRYSFCNAFGIMTGDEDTDAIVQETIPPVDVVSKPKETAPPKKPAKGDKKNKALTLAKTECQKTLRALFDRLGGKKGTENDLLKAVMMKVGSKDLKKADGKYKAFNELTEQELWEVRKVAQNWS